MTLPHEGFEELTCQNCDKTFRNEWRGRVVDFCSNCEKEYRNSMMEPEIKHPFELDWYASSHYANQGRD